MYNDILLTIMNAVQVLSNEAVLNRWVNGISSLTISIISSFFLYLCLKFILKTDLNRIEDAEVLKLVIVFAGVIVFGILTIAGTCDASNSFRDMYSPNLYLLDNIFKR